MFMIGSIIISVFLLMLILFVYLEYKNEKKYQEERRQRRQGNRKEEKRPIEKPTEVPEQILSQKNVEEEKPPSAPPQKQAIEKETLEQKSKKTPTVESPTIKKETVEVIEKPESVTVSLADYPKFDHSRLIDMGLSQEEAKEFVKELIPQIGTQIPLIKEAMAIPDFHNMERLTHSIKGSSTTVGTGGVSDLLVDYNTYLKTGTELAIAEAYFEHLKHYYEELKEQYA